MDDKLKSSPTTIVDYSLSSKKLNAYCTRVGLGAPPNIDELMKNEKVKVFHF